MRPKKSIIAVGLTVLVSATSALSLGAPPADVGALPAVVDRSWITQLASDLREGEYRFQLGPAFHGVHRGEMFQAPNRVLDLRLYLDAEGVEILERSLDAAPTVMRIALAGWGRSGTMDRSAAGALREVDGCMQRLRGPLTEGYVNSAAGLELIWEIDSPPAGPGPLFLELNLEQARASSKGGGVEVVSTFGRRVLLQAPSAADRNGGRVHVEFVVAERDRLKLVIEDFGAAYPLSIKTLLTGDADALLESNQPLAHFGSSVSNAGDVNNDGFDDVIVGANWYDNGQNDEGVALVFLGSPTGILGSSPADAHALIESNQENALLGSSVSTAGDVNGDGFDDVIVGARYYDNGETDEGASFVFLGSAAGIVGSNPADAHAFIQSDQTEAYLGTSVSSAGDVNGDGFDDVLVGAYGYDNGEINEGVALVFSGSLTGILGSSPADAYVLLESDQPDAYFGIGVSKAGDVNGDGFDDIVVGASHYDNGQTNEGAVLVFLGSAAGIVGSNLADAHAKFESDQADVWLGTSVSTAGDIDGDGFDDVIVGARYYNNGETSEGAALVFLGSAGGIVGSTPADAHALLESDQAFASLGYAVSTAGDVNGDGYADIIVGAPGYDNGETDEGAAFVFLGSAAGIVGSKPGEAFVQIESDQADGLLGLSVSMAGDVNGDDGSDVIVGSHRYDNGEANEGVTFIFHGAPAELVFADGFESGDTSGWSNNSR